MSSDLTFSEDTKAKVLMFYLLITCSYVKAHPQTQDRPPKVHGKDAARSRRARRAARHLRRR